MTADPIDLAKRIEKLESDMSTLREAWVKEAAGYDETTRVLNARNARALNRIEKLESALRQWPCDGLVHVDGILPDTACGRCHGTGLHPVASEALKGPP